MSPLELALKYLEIFYSGKNLNEMENLFTENLSFIGPLYRFHSAENYIKSSARRIVFQQIMRGKRYHLF